MPKLSAGKIFSIGMFLFLSACESVPERAQRSPSSDLPPKVLNSQTQGQRVTPEDLAENRFDWPVDSARLSRGFIPIPPKGKHRRPHYGIDLAAPKGTPIYSAQDGVVIYTGSGFKGFGKMIMVEGKNGYATLYAHLSKIKAKEGQRVNVGTEIGAMGRTGRATGTHLHFEIRKDRDPVNPLDYLPTTRVAGE